MADIMSPATNPIYYRLKYFYISVVLEKHDYELYDAVEEQYQWSQDGTLRNSTAAETRERTFCQDAETFKMTFT